MATPAKKAATKTGTAKKATPAKSATARKKATSKTTRAKSSGKTAQVSKPAAKKATPVKKATTNAPAAKKPAAPKAKPAKKTATKKAAAKAPAAKKETVKKTTAAKKVDTKPNTAKTEKKSPTPKKPKKAAAKAEAPKDVKRQPVKARIAGTKPKSIEQKETNVSTATAQKVDDVKIAQAKRPVKKAAKKSQDTKPVFKVNEQIVYPAHGVGMITDIEKQTIADMDIELFVINFEHEKMKLRVPLEKTVASGMRALSSNPEVDKALSILEGRARIKRTMWSRRAQEYEAKINSGSLKSVAEVVRDLYRSADQPEQSYSERQLYEAAVDRMAREVASVRKTDLSGAVTEMESWLHKKQVVVAAAAVAAAEAEAGSDAT